MIVPGALLSHIIGYFEEALRYEGGWPIPYIIAERANWDFKLLQSLLIAFKEELVRSYFASSMDAINYFEKIKVEVLQIAEQLHKEGII